MNHTLSSYHFYKENKEGYVGLRVISHLQQLTTSILLRFFFHLNGYIRNTGE